MFKHKKLYTQIIASDMKRILNRSNNYHIHHISGVPSVTCFYLKDETDLKSLSTSDKEKIKKLYFDYLYQKHYIPDMFKESEIEVFFDSDENFSSLSDQIVETLNKRYGYDIYRTDAAYLDTNIYGKKLKSYTVWIFFKTDKELQSFTELQQEIFKQHFIELLKEKGYIPNRIDETKIVFYFGTDESVQRNYSGNYFYAMR